MSVIVDPGTPDNQSLNSRQVKMIAENVSLYDTRSRNLVNAVTSDLNVMEKGETFTSKTAQRTGPRPVARADRYTDHNNKRLRKGERQASFEDFEDSVEDSSFERMEKMMNPLNEDVIAMGEGKNNHRDAFIMNRIFAPMQEAVDAENDGYGVRHTFQTINFPASQIVPVDYDRYHVNKSDGAPAPASADQGLTKSKLFGALERLESARMRGKLNVVCSQRDILNLATSLQLTSQDFVNQKLLADIDRVLTEENTMFLGMNFWDIHPENMVGHGTNAAQIAVFPMRVIQYKEKQVQALDISQLKERHYNWQAYYSIQSGLIRKDDTSVAQILVNHTDTPV